MKIRVPILVLSLFVCLRAFGAPSLSFSGGSMTVTVPAGHSVAWVVTENRFRAGITADPDNDGQIVIPVLQAARAVIVADVATGEWVTASPFGYAVANNPLPPGSLVRGTNGAISQMIFPTSEVITALWVRPGVGAWFPPTASVMDSDGSSNGLLLYQMTSMVPLGTTPATPAGVAHGDRLLTMDGFARVAAGIVDPFLDAPPSGGTVSFMFTESYVLEGASKAVRLMRVGGADGTVSVRCTTAAGSGETGVDFAPMDEILSFAPGEVLKSVQAVTVNDASHAIQLNNFHVVLSNPSGAVLGADTIHTISIEDNDPRPTIAFADVPATVVERDTSWSQPIPIVVNGAFRDPLPVTFRDGSNGPETNLTFQPPESRKNAALPIAADDLPTQSLVRTFRASSAISGYTNSIHGELTVLDDDPVSFAIQDATVGESALGVTLALKVDVPVSASVSWMTVDGTAKAGEDFFASGESASFNGRKETSIYVPLVRDEVTEGVETFYVDLTAFNGPVTSTRTRITITIVDDDSVAPAITILPVTMAEGNTGSTYAEVPVRLASAPATGVVLRVRTTDAGTASRGFTGAVDYNPIDELVTFAAGQTERIVRVQVFGDTIDENNETIEVAVYEKELYRTATRITIVDDDNSTASFSGVQNTTVEEQTGSPAYAVFRVTLSPAPLAEARLDYTTENLTALAGQDYVAAQGTLIFAAGQGSKDVSIQILGDSVIEASETFALRLSNPVGAYLQGDRAVATIFDDDDPAPAVTVTPISVIEGNSGLAQGALKVKLAHSVTSTVRLTLATTGSGSAASTDYQPLDVLVEFEPGQVERTVTVNVVGDTLVESNETFEVAVREGTTVRATANVTIVDDDTPISITVADVIVQEKTGPSATAAFRITLSPAPVTYATFEVETVNGTATAGADYLPLSGTVIFFAGQAQGDVEVEVFGDSLDEPNEAFTLRITNAAGANIVDGTATATIVDDDDSAPAAVSIAPVSVTERNSGQHAVDLHVRLGVALTAPLTLNVASNPGSAASSIDYQPISRTITFAPGQTEIVVQATIVGDVLDENHENFFVTASEGTTLRATGVVTILDDDSAPVFSVADTSVTEKTGTSAFAVFRVTLTPPPAGTANVAYATQNGTALAGADYLAANGVLTFSAGQASREVQVEVFGDAATEGTETFTLVLPSATATATILDDDATSTSAAISVADIEVRERDATSEATFTLTLSRAMTTPVTVSYSTFEHTASPPRDYEEKSGTVTFAPGETSRPVTVRIAGDREAEPREMFRLRLLSSDGAPIDDGTALCTIVDDDTLTKRRTSRH